MPNFQDLRAFQRAVDLTADVYVATEGFPRQELYGLTSQLRRAALSIVSNIAEGQGRLSYGERRQLFSQARGSLFEVQAQIVVARRLNFLSLAAEEHLKTSVRAAGRELAGLIIWIKHREAQSKVRKNANSQTPDP